MPKAYYLPPDDEGKDALLTNIANKLGNYKTTVGLEDAVVTSTQADAAYFHWALNSQKQVAAFAQQWTAYKNAARNGTDPSLGPVPTPPSLGTPPAAVAPGIFKRLAALVTRIKAHPGYTEAIGQDLNIIGAEQTVDTANAKPTIKLELSAGHPNVKWTKGGFDALEIWVDRGAGFAYPGHRYRAGLSGHRAIARRRPQRGLEIQGHLSHQRHPSRPMERCGEHRGAGLITP